MFADGSLGVRRIGWLPPCLHFLVPLCIVVCPVGARLTAVWGGSVPSCFGACVPPNFGLSPPPLGVSSEQKSPRKIRSKQEMREDT